MAAFIGLGSNIGDRADALRQAIDKIGCLPGTRVDAVSGFYQTPPWGPVKQEPFLNACVKIETTLSPHALLAACLDIEQALGRVRGVERYGPRRIDLDLLVYDDVIIEDTTLTLPHPHLLQRAFVLVPLVEIAPDLRVNGAGVKEALKRLNYQDIHLFMPQKPA